MSRALPRALALRRVVAAATAALWVASIAAGFVHRLLAAPVDPYLEHHARELVEPSLRWIGSQLEDASAARRMQAVFPEGALFSHSFYGFALVNLAMDQREDRELRAQVVGELRRLLAQPVWTPAVGIIERGHLALLRAGLLCLADDPVIEADFQRDSAALAADFAAEPGVNLPSYGEQTWPVDNLAALVALDLHDRLYGSAYGAELDRWVAWMDAHRDPHTGLWISEWSRRRQVAADGPRGSALSWSLAFLAMARPELARAEYARYAAAMTVDRGGLVAFREWPEGHERPADVDSGPVFFDVGMAASVFGVAAAKAAGDRAVFAGLVRLGEALGFPASSGVGRAYLGGQFLLGDVLAVWAKTWTPWQVVK